MRLTIKRGQHPTSLPGNPRGMMFAVSFRLTLSVEEQQWVERMSMEAKWISWPEGCPDAPKCGTPRWSLRDMLAGVELRPSASRSGDSSYVSLRQVLHAEEDVRHGCERLADALQSARAHHGVEEVHFGEERPG